MHAGLVREERNTVFLFITRGKSSRNYTPVRCLMKQHHIEIDKWLEDLRRCKSANLRKEEMEFIKELEQSTDKDQLIDDYLQDFITN